MRPLDIMRVALRGLTANKLRAFLTLLGVVIGVGAVISVMSIGKGSSAAIQQQIESIGTNLIFIRPGATTDQGVRSAQGSAATLTLEDAQALLSGDAPDIVAVAPEVGTFAQIRAGRQNTNTRITGVTPDYETIRNVHALEGRFISDTDVQGSTLNAVIGSNVAATLFPDSEPVGQQIMINQRPFRVVGLLETKGGTGLGNQDDIVLVPITTAQTRLSNQRTASGGRTVQSITVQAADKDGVEAAKSQIADILRERHRILGEDDFLLTTQDDLVAARTQVTNVLTILLGSIAGISLLVGGIGIMNIMLVTVTERTREIGLRKAVGAKRKDILAQFLGESLLLSLLGGGLGIALGWGTSKVVERFTINGQNVQTLVTADVVVLAVSVAAAIGLFFGIYPALRASRLDPIEALRST